MYSTGKKHARLTIKVKPLSACTNGIGFGSCLNQAGFGCFVGMTCAFLDMSGPTSVMLSLCSKNDSVFEQF